MELHNQCCTQCSNSRLNEVPQAPEKLDDLVRIFRILSMNWTDFNEEKKKKLKKKGNILKRIIAK